MNEHELGERIARALEIALRFGGIDGDHHKAWVIDQMTRVLTGPSYQIFVDSARADGAYEWNEGIAP